MCASQPSPSGTPAAALSGRSPLALAVRLLRVRQWIKNAFVFVPLLFASGSLAQLIDGMPPVALAALAFCLMSSAVYVWNDVTDASADRLHPVKRRRPIASGEVSAPFARGLALLLASAAISLAFAVGPWVAAVALGYLINNMLYSRWFKHVQLADLFSISAGFLLRIAAGAAAIHVGVSAYLFFTAFFLTLFLGLGKRRHECILLGDAGAEHRPVLRDYSVYYIDQLMLLSATMTLMVYCLYVLERRSLPLTLTIPVVTLGLFRYFHITHNLQGGEPTDDLVSDPGILIAALLYGALALIGLSGMALPTLP